VLVEAGAAGLVARAAAEAPPSPLAGIQARARELAEAMRELPLAETVRQLVGAPAPHSADPASFLGRSPSFGKDCYVAPGATVIGDVGLGDDCSVWPGAVLRGDVNRIRIGSRSNVQDGAVVHVNPGEGHCRIGEGVTIGHQATVHSCWIGDDVLIGIHSVVLDGASIGERCIVGAGAVVTPGTVIPPGQLVLGVPARVARELTAAEIESILRHAESYASLKNQYLRPAAAPVPAPAEAPAPPPAPPRGELPRYACRRVDEPVVADGSLDDDAWSAVPPMAHLRLATGAGNAVLATEVKACWDDAHLYVAFSCHDTDVWSTYTERDQPLYDEEVVEVFLCPSGDPAHYFEFEVNPLNAVFDARVFSPEGDRRSMLVDPEWNAAGLRTGVRVSGNLATRENTDIGWIAELAIPFADLDLDGPPAPGTVWRANFYRIERGRVEEFSAWSPTFRDPADFHVPACFGELHFVE
jgi:carbonic anhydrase/acetyltransferase-like protein (isoleucine patch superfamily)